MDLINRLPQEIITEILMRLPYIFHKSLKQVCRAWRDMVRNSSFYDRRIDSGLSQKFICLLHRTGLTMYDPVRGFWHRSPPLPIGFKLAFSTRLVCWRRKLVFIGLKRYNRETRSILVYDFCFNRWHVGTEMPEMQLIKRFVCCASPQGTVYVAGDRLAAVYDINTDEWELLPPMPRPTGLASVSFTGGKFYVFDLQNDEVQNFDPNTGLWTPTDNISGIQHKENVLYAFGKLFVFGGQEITEHDLENGNSRQVISFREVILSKPGSAAVWCDRIVFAGVCYHSNGSSHRVLYMLKANAGVSERLIAINPAAEFRQTNVLSVTTVEL
ncbi:F-box/kelch-repeat protein At2g44130-like [Cryptomeria japonica]|uniref:F-box/kelch-repeat protein At2g44130-like n=1 Tax=Cryptomeria japonica TaxID=3369 RepID=UPI0027DA72B9|nr:F-box/kelch-repeat protein At2g44130-like [Cryptomeria japonica]